MRPALLVSIMLFLLVEAQGIRLLQQEVSLADHHKFHEEKDSNLMKESGGVGDRVGKAAAAVICKDGHCSGTMKKKGFSRVAKEVHHVRPVFHEDYYGPRSHKPRHH